MNDIVLQRPKPPRSTALTKAQKAAVILCLLDKNGAVTLFEELGEASIRNFVRAMAQIEDVEGEVVKSIVAEFVAGLEQRGQAVSCGAQSGVKIVENNLGRATAVRITGSMDLVSEKNVWKRVSLVNPEVISDFVSREHPQSAAVILTKLAPEYSGRVLSELEPEQARQIAKYLRSTKGIGGKPTEIIGQSIGNFLHASRLGALALTPAERMGAIMNYTSTQVREDLIEHLDEIDPEFAGDVRRSMFTFADIEQRVARSDVSKIVKALDNEVLINALADADSKAQSVKSFFLASISTRMSAMIEQEIKDAGAIKRKLSETAQADIIQVIIQLEATGEIALIKEDEE